MKEKYLKRFEKTGKPKWAEIQDEKEKELNRKYPDRFRDFCEKFYRSQNSWPTDENTWESFKDALKKEKKIMKKKTTEAFFKCFVKKEDLPEKEFVNIYQPDKPFKRRCPAFDRAISLLSHKPLKTSLSHPE